MHKETPKLSISGRDPSQFAQLVFSGFPYLLTQIVGTFYHITLLPPEFSSEALQEGGLRQARANRLPTYILTDGNTCTYFDPESGHVAAAEIPPARRFVHDRLRPWVDFLKTLDFVRREQLLEVFVKERNRGATYLFGDLAKGGSKATAAELRRLCGFQANGIPRGLKKCWQCGDWRGVCLDPNPRFAGMAVRVCCRCENDNRCARCGELLNDHKLNANFFEPKDGKVWHVPGFSGLSHQCRITQRHKDEIRAA